MKRVIAVALLLALICSGASAQSRSETRQYNKTISKPSVAAFDKFLKKYPSSVYAEDIRARRDTLLSISPYSESEAAEIIRGFLPEGAEYKAIPLRSEGTDRIYAVCIAADSLSLDRVRFYTFEKAPDKGRKIGAWSLRDSYEAPSADAEGMTERQFADSSFTFRIRGNDYFAFSCLLSSADRSQQAYVISSYCPGSDEFDYVSFRGKNALTAGDGAAYRLYGRTDNPDGQAKPQVRLLLSRLQANQQLEAIPERDYQTDEAIRWWVEHNPDALTTANKLSFNILPAESSLVEDFAAAKGKVSSAKYRAVIMDIRGYSVIVVYQKESADYVLAWAEPECRNQRTDRLLNSISFDDANSLTMFYYQGRRTFKYRLNLASKTLRR